MLAKTEAIVLRSMRYRETSRIVTFYTEQFGKTSGIAKGARDMKSKFGSSLIPMTHVSLVFYRKPQREINLVSQCDTIDSFKHIQSDMNRMSSAMNILELTNIVIHGEEQNPSLFALLHKALCTIDTMSGNPQRVFDTYQLKLVSLFGFKPSLESCRSCGSGIQSMDDNSQCDFYLGNGVFECSKCVLQRAPQVRDRQLLWQGSSPNKSKHKVMKISGRTLKLIHDMNAADLSNVSSLAYDAQVGNELRESIRSYLESHFEELRPLKSEKVFDQLNQNLVSK